ncbi:MAG: S-layer homology domain-containing protein [Clostridia bacterium]|nr:S-layer homology domain-containing protein [Clostridia bacterium]
MKKLLAFVLSLTLLLSTAVNVSFAADFVDVDADDSYAEAVNMLVDLNILDGYKESDGLYFKPNGTITRAEVAKIIACLLGARDMIGGTTHLNLYTDVPASHWSSGYVNYLSGYNNIIAGYGNGMFGPSDPVTYEQAVKMLVCTLGYYPMAIQRGGYPTGFLAVASELGLTKGATGQAGEAAKRSVVARMAYNALTAPMMKQTGWNPDSPEYTVTGTGGYEKETLLLNYLDVTKINAYVTETYLQNTNVDKEDLYILLRNKDGSVIEKDGEDVLPDGGKISVGSTNAADYLGYAVTAYIFHDEEDETTRLVAISPRGTQNKNISLSLSNIENDSVTFNKKGFYTLKDDDDATYRIDENAKIFVNSEESNASFEDLIARYGGTYGNLSLLENESADKNADYVFFEVISRDYVVSEVNTRTGKVTFKNGGSRYLDPESDNAWITLTKDENSVSLKELKAGDVLTIVENDSKTVVKAYVCTDTIRGKLSGKTGNKYIVGGTRYEYTSDNSLKNISVGDTGVFYLNTFGYLVYFDRTSAASSMDGYAYLFATAAQEDKFGKDLSISFRLFDSDGYWVEYDLAEKVSVYRKNETHRSSDREDFMKNIGAWSNGYITASLADLKISGSGLLQYGLNSSGQINELYIPSYGALTESYLSGNYFSEQLFDKDDYTLGKMDVTDKTLIITVKGGNLDNEESFSLASYKSVFSDGKKYRGYGFVSEDGDDGAYDAILLYTQSSFVENSTRFIVVSETGYSLDKNDDGREAVYGYTGGRNNEREFFMADDYSIDREIVTAGGITHKKDISYDDIKTGDVIAATFNSDGEIAHLRLLSDVSDILASDGKGYYFSGKDANKDDIEIMYGYVAEERIKSDSSIFILSETVVEDDEDIQELARLRDHRLKGSVYYVDLTGRSVAFDVQDNFEDVNAHNAYVKNGETVHNNYGYFIYAKTVENDIVDAVVYIMDCADMLTLADYSAVKDALASVPKDLSLYTDESRQDVELAISAVVYGQNQSAQKTVDGYAKAIRDAVLALVLKKADYSRVEEAIAGIPHDLSGFTESSAKAVTDAKNAVIYDLDITKQAQVDAFAKAIVDAVAALVSNGADYTAVNAAIARIPQDLTIYTESSAKAVTDAKNAVVFGLPTEEQTTVDGYATAISDALAGLVYKPADYSLVENAIAAIPSDLSGYTSESAQAVTDAKNAVVYELPIIEQERVNGFADAIFMAIDRLEVPFAPASYTAVQAAIDAVPEDLSGYTEESVRALQAAIDAVVYDLSADKQDRVDAYARDILSAIEDLEPAVYADYTRLDAIVATIPSDLTDYTSESTAALTEALDAVVYNLTADKQSLVDAFCISLEEAISNLTLKKADYTQVEKALALIPDDLSIYTEESVLAVTNAKNAVVPDMTIDHQEEVDAFAKAIRDAVSNLATKDPADYTAVTAALASIPEDLSVYTDKTAAAVTAAKKAVVYNLPADRQAEVDAFALAIKNAVAALVFKDADYTAVTFALGRIPAYLDVYTKESVAALNTAKSAVVQGKKMNEQSIVDGYATAIHNAIAGLKVLEGYEDIEKALKTIPSDLSVYTDASVKALKATLALIDYTKAPDAEELITYKDAITSAVKALVAKPSKASALRTTVIAPRSLYTNKPNTVDFGMRW